MLCAGEIVSCVCNCSLGTLTCLDGFQGCDVAYASSLSCGHLSIHVVQLIDAS